MYKCLNVLTKILPHFINQFIDFKYVSNRATRIVLDIILFFDRIYRIDFYPVTKYLINKTVQLLKGSL